MTKQLILVNTESYKVTLDITPVPSIDGLFQVVFTRDIGSPFGEQRTIFFWDTTQIQAVKEFL